MTIDEFWQHVAEAKRHSRSVAEVPDQLVSSLSRQPDDEIVSFGRHFQDCINRANDGSLWLAASVLRGGCSDDSFDYFMDWLVAQGKQIFEAALLDPDSIAGIERLEGAGGLVRLEAMLSVDVEAYERKAGPKDLDAQDRYERLCAGQKSERWGTKNQEFLNYSDEEGAQFFPKLAARHDAEKAKEHT